MCAKREPIKECPRCKDKVCRVEQSGLGTFFMCTHGGSRYNNKGCRRTYLSQRDLQAHINHRHVTIPAVPARPAAAADAVPEKQNNAGPGNLLGGGRKNNSAANANSAGNSNMRMKESGNDQDGGHFSSRQRYANAHYESSGGGSGGNYR